MTNDELDSTVRDQIFRIISDISPYDAIEAAHQADALAWIESGEEIFRIEKPATPPKHLVCYTIVYDPDLNSILLVDHKKAQKYLPTGGHVDKNELPHDTAKREIYEELGESLEFYINDKPLFISQCAIVDFVPGHINVDLWYIFKRDSKIALKTDTEDFTREFNDHKWVKLEEILDMDISKLEPHMKRFI